MIPAIHFSQIGLGFITLQTWGLMAALGFLFGLIISLGEAKRKGYDREEVWNLMLVSLFSMFIGGKIFYILLTLIDSRKFIFEFGSGFSLIGGGISTVLSVFLYLKIKKQNWKFVFDLLTPGVVAALILVRCGCFLISDHIGGLTDFFWGMEYLDGTTRHPVALYHILFLSLILLAVKKLQGRKMADGFLFFYFLVLYSFFGFFADFSRCSDLAICDAHFWGMTATQWMLVPVFLFSLFEIKKLRKVVL